MAFFPCFNPNFFHYSSISGPYLEAPSILQTPGFCPQSFQQMCSPCSSFNQLIHLITKYIITVVIYLLNSTSLYFELFSLNVLQAPRTQCCQLPMLFVPSFLFPIIILILHLPLTSSIIMQLVNYSSNLQIILNSSLIPYTKTVTKYVESASNFNVEFSSSYPFLTCSI